MGRSLLKSMGRVSLLLCLLATLAFPSAADAGQVAPCALITQADAQAILGEAVKPPRMGKVTGFAAGRSCKYFTAAPMAQRGGVGSVTLVVHDAKTMEKAGLVFTSPVKFFNKTRKMQKKAVDIKGLGQAAFWQPGSDRLHILNNGLYLILQIRDLAKFSSKKGRADLQAKVSAHRLKLCEAAARKYILPKL